jgi:hypothetical protein
MDMSNTLTVRLEFDGQVGRDDLEEIAKACAVRLPDVVKATAVSGDDEAWAESEFDDNGTLKIVAHSRNWL